MDKNKNRFIDAEEIMELTGLSKSASYRLIQQLNEELAHKTSAVTNDTIFFIIFYLHFL